MKQQIHNNDHRDCHTGMDAILELIDGQRIEATLAKPFNPEDNEVELLIGSAKKKQNYFFPDICCVSMMWHRDWLHLFQKGVSQEAVTTVIGKTYHVNVPDKQPAASGFFGLTIDDNTPYRLVFFT